MGRASPEASHLHLHPNSFQVAVRFLENQSPLAALTGSLPPSSHLGLPRLAPTLSGAKEAPVKMHTPGCLLLAQRPSSSGLH